jgi:hypothetical protein
VEENGNVRRIGGNSLSVSIDGNGLQTVRWLQKHINPKAVWSYINVCLDNKQKTAYGFRWSALKDSI